MAKYKKYNYSQMVMLPISLEDQLVPGTLEFAIHTLVEKRMDLSRFDEKYHNDEIGRSAYDPKILLKVVSCDAANRTKQSSPLCTSAAGEKITMSACLNFGSIESPNTRTAKALRSCRSGHRT